jgi:hypothetical protein
MLFALYSLFSSSLFVFVVPPFQHPEEVNHFLRASQLASGGLVGKRFVQPSVNAPSFVTAGGKIDPATVRAAWPFVPMMFRPNVRANAAMWSAPQHWSGARKLWPFPNTVIYPPVFYAPAIAAIGLGRVLDLTVLHTLLLGRALTALAVASIGTLAVAAAEGAAPWVFTVLLLPMSLDIAVSVSQDGLMLACGALAGALLVRALSNGGATARFACIGMAVLLSLVAMARPPYLVLASLPLLIGAVPWRTRLAASGASVGAVLAWSALAAATDLTNLGAGFGANGTAQANYLRQHIFAFPAILWRTLRDEHLQFLQQFLGRLGWDDTKLPTAYYAAALAALVLAAAISLTAPSRHRVPAQVRCAVLAAGLVAATSVFLSLYLAWTVPGYPTVGGVEGRYFLPIALVGAVLVIPVGVPRSPLLQRLRMVSFAIIAAFPAVSIGTMWHTFLLRYGAL